MAYEKINWANQATPLNANNLNHMEDGIAETDVQSSTLAIFEALGWESVDSNVISSLLSFIGGKLSEEVWSIVHPVGSYYETSDTSFDPNEAWGGTWVEDTAGRVTVAQDTSDTSFDVVGETGGSKYIQAHTHSHTNPTVSGGNHEHTIKRNETAGSGSSKWSPTNDGSNTVMTTTGGGAHTHTVSGGGVGAVAGVTTGNAGNLQPYIVVKRWHRTA